MSTVYVYGASIDENGKAHGGKAGNQTGRELRKQKWYKHSKGWRVFRAKLPEVAAQIAQDVKWAVANMAIGYDQYQRLTMYEAAKPFGFNCKLVKTPCETDCSALVRVCCAYASIMLPKFRTTTEPSVLLNSGAFEELVGAKYTDSPDYLKAGDILCTRTQGHTVIVGNDGPKAEDAPAPAKLGDRDLRRGCKGEDVKELQRDLLKLGYTLGDYGPDHNGVDGDFGSKTEKAVKKFQADHSLPVDGEMKSADYTVFFAALDGQDVELGTEPPPPVSSELIEITGNSVNVRTGPGVTGTRILGVAHKGDRLPYGGLSMNVDGRDWYMVEYHNTNAWVSSKFSRFA